MSTGLAVVLGVMVGLAAGAGALWAVLSRRLGQVLLERDAARDESAGQRDAVAELRAQLASAEADRAARVEEMAKQQAEIEGRFKEIAAQVSETTRDAFMKEFRDLSAEQTKTAGKTVSELVKPMRERLQELQEHVSKADKARVEDTAKVSQSVDQLVSETSGLRQILRDSKMRGAWGEQHLRNVIEAAGMSRHIDYIEQATVGELGAEGRLRPDVVVKAENFDARPRHRSRGVPVAGVEGGQAAAVLVGREIDVRAACFDQPSGGVDRVGHQAIGEALRKQIYRGSGSRR